LLRIAQSGELLGGPDRRGVSGRQRTHAGGERSRLAARGPVQETRVALRAGQRGSAAYRIRLYQTSDSSADSSARMAAPAAKNEVISVSLRSITNRELRFS